ncbi:MAG: acyltransferase [Alphaproteobacteria bacterium]|nr:acyltransferase [Alphaproteobacteria bacterium]
MIRSLYIRLLKKAGKTYQPDPKVPTSVLLGEIFARSIMLLRGVLRCHSKAFLGKSITIRGKKFLKLGRFTTLCNNVYIDAVSQNGVTIGDRTKIGAYTQIGCTNHFATLGKGVQIGKDSGLGQFSFIGAAGGVTIGDNVVMGQYVSFHAQQHVFDDPAKPIREQGVSAEGITLESDIWVGAKATFLDGAYIGRHSVVAAGAVVRGKFPPGSVIGGVPAKIIKTLPLVES